MFFFAGAYFSLLYYIPIYFQSIHNSSPIASGVRMLAFIIPMTIAAIVQGFALMKIGIVPLFWIFGASVATIGCGLLYTMDQNTSTGKWIGYQIIVGFVSGWTFQVAIANVQVHTPPEDMSQATAITQGLLTIGGAFLLSAAQSAFNNRLIIHLASTLPDVNAGVALGTGATQIREVFTAEQIPFVIDGYVEGLKAVFAITIGAFGMATLVGFFGSWRRLGEKDLKAAAGGAA